MVNTRVVHEVPDGNSQVFITPIEDHPLIAVTIADPDRPGGLASASIILDRHHARLLVKGLSDALREAEGDNANGLRPLVPEEDDDAPDRVPAPPEG